MEKNTGLSERITTSLKTSQVAAWLLEQMDKLLKAAPPNCFELEILPYRNALKKAVTDYWDNRKSQTEEQRAARKKTHERLISITVEAIQNLATSTSIQLIRWPIDQGFIENVVDNYVQSGDMWRCACTGCGARIAISVAIEVRRQHFCAKCLIRYTSKCAACGGYDVPEYMRSLRDNDKRTVASLCEKCPDPTNSISCGDCYVKFAGKPSSSPGLSAERIKQELGIELCWHCSGAYRLVSCGHISTNPKKVSEVPNVEDDPRDREELVFESKLICEACHREVNGGDDRIDFWGATKKMVACKAAGDLGSKRSFGVELEVCKVRKIKALPDHIKAVWTAKPDGSLPQDTGMELASTILFGDAGLKVVSDLCDYAKDQRWSVDARAGFHLHVGLAGETDASVAAVVIGYLMTYDMWSSFVAASRVRCKYCRKNRCTPEALVGMRGADMVHRLIQEDRRVWCNWHAYTKQSTIEIRFHQATLNYTKISNWAKAHTRFVDWCVGVGDSKKVYDKLRGKTVRQIFLIVCQEAWKDRALGRWFRSRSQELLGEMSPLPQSNRKLRKAGIDPKKPRPSLYQEIKVAGRTCFPFQYARGIWGIADTPHQDNYFLGQNGWGGIGQMYRLSTRTDITEWAFKMATDATRPREQVQAAAPIAELVNAVHEDAIREQNWMRAADRLVRVANRLRAVDAPMPANPIPVAADEEEDN